MNTKSDCWLCGRGYGLDNGGMVPGEMHRDRDGDMVCIYCEDKINFTAHIMENPDLIELVGQIDKLPKVEGVSIGIKFTEDE